MLRNTDVLQIPNPDENLEDFLVYFLKNYQSDHRITYLDDLSKLLNDDFFDLIEKEKFIKIIGDKTENEIKQEMESVEIELKNEGYKNFYNLILSNKIELIIDGKK